MAVKKIDRKAKTGPRPSNPPKSKSSQLVERYLTAIGLLGKGERVKRVIEDRAGNITVLTGRGDYYFQGKDAQGLLIEAGIVSVPNPVRKKKQKVAGQKLGEIRLEIGDLPKPGKAGQLIFVGEIRDITYKTMAEKLYNHEFSEPLPYLLSDGTNFFVKNRRKDLHFDLKRGIIN